MSGTAGDGGRRRAPSPRTEAWQARVSGGDYGAAPEAVAGDAVLNAESAPPATPKSGGSFCGPPGRPGDRDGRRRRGRRSSPLSGSRLGQDYGLPGRVRRPQRQSGRLPGRLPNPGHALPARGRRGGRLRPGAGRLGPSGEGRGCAGKARRGDDRQSDDAGAHPAGDPGVVRGAGHRAHHRSQPRADEACPRDRADALDAAVADPAGARSGDDRRPQTRPASSARPPLPPTCTTSRSSSARSS